MFRINVDQDIVIEQVKGQVFVLTDNGDYVPVNVGDRFSVGAVLFLLIAVKFWWILMARICG
ncbi:hypothetical protein CRG86_011025 [Photobacterium leiognathi]|nr:hypothetical protein CRG86_011025 [Photobacterium leiognathi]